LSEDQQAEIVQEIMAILNHPDFAPIFGPGSMAEVPITGLLDESTLISGQIDRLLITDNEILIVDYKTNRPPPDNVDDVPIQYKNQLQSYARTLEKIYPDRPIKTALLWTNVPALMDIELH
jgi:ATP-dependent helicase/nuclease subunit A